MCAVALCTEIPSSPVLEYLIAVFISSRFKTADNLNCHKLKAETTLQCCIQIFKNISFKFLRFKQFFFNQKNITNIQYVFSYRLPIALKPLVLEIYARLQKFSTYCYPYMKNLFTYYF